jgi:hypothetical protein
MILAGKRGACVTLITKLAVRKSDNNGLCLSPCLRLEPAPEVVLEFDWCFIVNPTFAVVT